MNEFSGQSKIDSALKMGGATFSGLILGALFLNPAINYTVKSVNEYKIYKTLADYTRVDGKIVIPKNIRFGTKILAGTTSVALIISGLYSLGTFAGESIKEGLLQISNDLDNIDINVVLKDLTEITLNEEKAMIIIENALRNSLDKIIIVETNDLDGSSYYTSENL